MTANLTETLRVHALWLAGDPPGTRADLRGANLRGANLRGANLRHCGQRSDGYVFLVRHEAGEVFVTAGCRRFGLAEARAHWTATRGGTPLGDESLALVDHCERMARIAGWLPATPSKD